MRVICHIVLVVLVLTTAIEASEHKVARRIRRQDGEFECPQPSGNFANPKNCRRFYQCVDNFAYSSRCPAGLKFDDIDKFCTEPKDARCGPIAQEPVVVVKPEDQAPKCNMAACSLPNCYCSNDGTAIPGGLEPEKTPQMVLISMDDSVNHANFDSYKNVFKGRKNPNNCPIRGTFFLSHEYSNYKMIQDLFYEGHEIATYSVSHRRNMEQMNYTEWVNEQIGMRSMLENFASIPKDEIVGMRAPALKPGRNAQYEVLNNYGYFWDSSASVPPLKVPVWPYTLDYAIPHECRSGTCPTRAFPGIWEFPLNSHYNEGFEGGYCPYMDQCVLHNLDAEDVFQWLQEDFSRYYDQNRAPYTMPFHTSWFQQPSLVGGLTKFLDWLTEKPDVWFLTTTQALYWITEPVPISELRDYANWDCTRRVLPPKPCNLPNSCGLPFQNSDTRYMTTCASCPQVYPWLLDARGTGSANDVYDTENPNL